MNYGYYQQPPVTEPKKPNDTAKWVKIIVSLLINAAFLYIIFGLLSAAALQEGVTLFPVKHEIFTQITAYLTDPALAAFCFWWIVPFIPVFLIRYVVIPIGERRQGARACALLAMVVPVVSFVAYLVIKTYFGIGQEDGGVTYAILQALFLFSPALLASFIIAVRVFRKTEKW